MVHGQQVMEADEGLVTAAPETGRVLAPTLATIVLIADVGPWSERTSGFLDAEGFLVLPDPTGDAAFDHRARSADAAIVDLGLSARPAIEVCAAWRSRSAAPIMALARVRDETTLLDAYAAGADQVAPIDITGRQLLARLRSVLRRSPVRRTLAASASDDRVPIRLDPGQLVAVVNGTQVPITQPELEFLELLIDRAGRVVARAELSAALQLPSSSERAIDFFVRRLREKLERVDPHRRILVVRGVGFRFDASSAVPP